MRFTTQWLRVCEFWSPTDLNTSSKGNEIVQLANWCETRLRPHLFTQYCLWRKVKWNRYRVVAHGPLYGQQKDFANVNSQRRSEFIFEFIHFNRCSVLLNYYGMAYMGHAFPGARMRPTSLCETYCKIYFWRSKRIPLFSLMSPPSAWIEYAICMSRV